MLRADLWTVGDPGRFSRARNAKAQLPRIRRGPRKLLFIVANPQNLWYVADPMVVPGPWERIDAWVFDSFWSDQVPRLARRRNWFDQLWITDGDLVVDWRDRTRTPVGWLPWGADVLGQADALGPRPIDLLRIGRQPSAWDNDARVAAFAHELGVTFAGRPPLLDDPAANQASLGLAMREAKYVLAFSNRVSPAAYTHPSREYVTARWTDALAVGAGVAGVVPRTPTAELLWRPALLSVPPDDLTAGLRAVRVAAEQWSPELALGAQRDALLHLDWRHRIVQIADAWLLDAPELRSEIRDLHARADRLEKG